MTDSPEQTIVIHVAPGEVLDSRWRIEARIGQGAMGSVFRGKDLTTNELVAVKILAPEHCRKPRVVARFEREAGQMTKLRHANLVSFLGHGRRGVLPFIVMEFLPGLTLTEVLEKQPQHRLPLAETVTIIRQIGAGLSFLHAQGLVHRDIKPQNVFLASGGRVTILDLGVVRDLSNPGLTRPGAMVGTPYYMSPEQILGVEDIDHRTDVYALAAVTFELLTGRPPYLGNNNFEVLYGHKNSPPPNASELVSSVPERVSELIIAGLAKRRDERIDSVNRFVKELIAAAGTKLVDLGDFDVSHPERTRVTRGTVSAGKALPLPNPKPKPKPRPRPVESVPEAENSDVLSVPHASLGGGEEEEMKTALFEAIPLPVAPEPEPEAEEEPEPEPEPPPPSPPIEKPQTRVSKRPTPVAPPPEPSPPPPPVAPPVLAEPEPPNAGTLKVRVSARGFLRDAIIFVGGKKRGFAPAELKLSAGPHHLRVEAPGYKPVERWASISTGATANLNLYLEQE